MSQASIPKKIICIGDIFSAPFYVSLTLVALASTAVPVLRDLSAHGKTRRNKRGERSSAGAGGDADRRPRLLRLLSSDLLLVNKRHFLQFYVAGIAVTLLIFILRRIEDRYYEPVGGSHKFGPQALATFLLLTHLIRRCYECLYVHAWADGTMHAAGYALGILHYVVLPFVFLGDGEHDWCCEFSSSSDGDGRGDGYRFGPGMASGLLIGVALVCFGQFEQYRHHCILSELRPMALRRRWLDRANRGESFSGSGEPKDPGKDGYSIPNGRWFRYISCPHYLTEIVIYVGFAILLQSSPKAADVKCNVSSSIFGQVQYGYVSGSVHFVLNLALNMEEYRHIALLVWVVTNLSISAMRSHAYYVHRFGPGYPSQRKVLVPFIW